MFFKLIYRLLVCSLILFFLNLKPSFGIEDGFGSAKKIKSKHFTIYCAQDIEVTTLIQQLDIGSSDKLLAGKPMDEKNSSQAELADMLDTLFMRVCNILDMPLYSFQGNIKICKDIAQLATIYYNLFNKELHAPSFYVFDFNTIYVSLENFKRQIVGHEIAHAIISRYFVVLPPIKVQEILAGYVEYQLRK
ncbi:MAG: hypothetical protein NC935_07360 [Candidatus Omnitrophica bacterium]|nr:hypothetical protein [Candidatus Omnitrophota bacterium]